MVGLWVIVDGVIEFTLVVFLIESTLGVLGDTDEVVDVEFVGEVFVEVVLEVLDKIHVLLDEIVASNSWEREGLVVKLPGVDRNLWVLALLLQLLVYLHSLLVMLIVEASREVVEFDIQLLLRNINSWLTRSH